MDETKDQSPAQIRTAIVINDELTQLTLIATLLEHEGLVVLSYQNAEDALAYMRQHAPPALVVTDLYMPGFDGWRVCRLLRSPEYLAFNQTPLMVVSATFSGAEAQAITAHLGANAFVPVPFEIEDWHKLVQSVLAGESLKLPCQALIVDDDQMTAEMLAKAFAAHGYRTSIALTGEAARQLFRERPPQVVIMDYHLPDVDGSQLISEFAAADPRAVVLMTTGDTTPELATLFMRRGAAAYVQKPVDPAYLITLCERALRERALLRVEDFLAERTKQLRESEARYRGLFSSMVSGFALHEILCDSQGRPNDYRFLEVNPTFEKLLGLSRERVVGQTALALMPDMEPEWIAAFGEVALSGKPAHFERYNRALDKHLEVMAFRPAPRQFAITFVDITDRKRAQEDREHLIKQLQEALNNLKTLSGLLPICSSCKRIRDDKGYWNQVESYIQEHSDARFTHSICPECSKRHFPEFQLPDDPASGFQKTV